LATDVKAFDRLSQAHVVAKKIVVSLDETKRLLANGVLVLPWRVFLQDLWAGDLF
jgi:hypothetical protein